MAKRTYTLAEAIGKRLLLAREARGISVRDLARRAMVGTNTILRLTAGTSINPGVGTLYDLARALEVPPEWLICGVEGEEG